VFTNRWTTAIKLQLSGGQVVIKARPRTDATIVTFETPEWRLAGRYGENVDRLYRGDRCRFNGVGIGMAWSKQ